MYKKNDFIQVLAGEMKPGQNILMNSGQLMDDNFNTTCPILSVEKNGKMIKITYRESEEYGNYSYSCLETEKIWVLKEGIQ